jgi:ribosomal protein S20
MMKTVIAKALNAITTTESKTDAATKVHDAIALIDRVACKGILHRNTASRYVSQLAKKLNGMPG